MIFLLTTLIIAFVIAYKIWDKTRYFRRMHQYKMNTLTDFIEANQKKFEIQSIRSSISSESLQRMKISTQKIGHLVLDLQKIMLNLVAKHK